MGLRVNPDHLLAQDRLEAPLPKKSSSWSQTRSGVTSPLNR